jgi:hypothetical protein
MPYRAFFDALIIIMIWDSKRLIAFAAFEQDISQDVAQ